MKTENFVLAVLAVITVTLLGGCFSLQQANLKSEGEEIYRSQHGGLLPGPDNAVNVATAHAIMVKGAAEAYQTIKQADTNAVLVAALIKEQAADGEAYGRGEKSYNYIFALVNNDPRQAIYIDHPERPSEKVTARPNGGTEYVFVKAVPYMISYRRLSDGKIFKKYFPRSDYRFAEKISYKKTINGVKVDLVLQVNQVP